MLSNTDSGCNNNTDQQHSDEHDDEDLAWGRIPCQHPFTVTGNDDVIIGQELPTSFSQGQTTTAEDTMGKESQPLYKGEEAGVTAPTLASKQRDVQCVDVVDIAIIGGGLAGLATAVGLHRLLPKHIKCRVYERAPRLRTASQGILAIKANGMRALRSIHPDLPSLVKKAGCEKDSGYLMTVEKKEGTALDAQQKDGEEASAQEEGENHVGSNFLVTETVKRVPPGAEKKVTIQWHALQAALASLLPAGIVSAGKSFHSFQQHQQDTEQGENCLLVHFEDGTSVQASIVLGCDGVFSTVRKWIFPSPPNNDFPVYFGQMNWNAIVPTSTLPHDTHLPRTTRYVNFNDDETRWTAILSDCGDDHTYWQLRVTDSGKTLALSGSKGRGGLGLVGIKERLLPVVSPSRIVREVLENIPESHIFERCIVGRLPAPTWIGGPSGRVALVGDAAHGMHPNIAQGGNSAFESVAALMTALSTSFANGDDWTEGLQLYEKARKARADTVQRFANMMGCFQSTGNTPLSSEEMWEMVDWSYGGKGEIPPPLGVLKVLESFDPLRQPGVTFIK